MTVLHYNQCNAWSLRNHGTQVYKTDVFLGWRTLLVLTFRRTLLGFVSVSSLFYCNHCWKHLIFSKTVGFIFKSPDTKTTLKTYHVCAEFEFSVYSILSFIQNKQLSIFFLEQIWSAILIAFDIQTKMKFIQIISLLIMTLVKHLLPEILR